MTRTPLDTGWTIRPKTSMFVALTDGEEARTTVRVPHDAALALERTPHSDGGTHNGYVPSATVEYQLELAVPEGYRRKRVAIEFEAVHRDAMVYVNDDFAGQRPNGYTGFSIDLDPYLRYGETNRIRVDARAHDDSRWYAGLGIHRDVWLVVSEPVHVDSALVQVTTPDIEEALAVVVVSVPVVNTTSATQRMSVRTEITGTAGIVLSHSDSPVTVRPHTTATVRLRHYVATPALWSVEHPVLHTAKVELFAEHDLVDSTETSFGIRRLQLDPAHGLRINGETVKLRGACVHHDNGILGAASIGRSDERRVELLKAAGFNAIRSAHNPISRAMLEACDRVGMLVMDETFDVWTVGKSHHDYSLRFAEWWERDVTAMVQKDFNHPSVVFYSIGNEIPETGTPLGSEWGRRIADRVRELDPSRFVTNAINGFVSVLPEAVELLEAAGGNLEGGVNAAMESMEGFMSDVIASPLVTERTAESFAILDAAGINYGAARYDLDRDLFPDRIIIGTETYPGDIATNWSAVLGNPRVIGDFTWTGWDYLGEVGIGAPRYDGEDRAFGAPYPWRLAWCGDIDITGHRRPASYYREIIFGRRQRPYIAVQHPDTHGRTRIPGQWSWSDSIASWSWDVADGTMVTVEIYSDADAVELLVNGTPSGRAPAGRSASFRAEFDVPYRHGEVTAVAYRNDVEVGRHTLRSATGRHTLNAQADRRALVADHSDLAFVSITLQGTNGVVIPDADRPVTVDVSGPAVLQGLGSARPDQPERYDGTTHTSFRGRLLAVVRPDAPGAVEVIVSAPGCEDVVVPLTVVAPGVHAG